MVLPKVIYENLPFAYFILSGYLLSLDGSWPMIFSAALFYGAACITFVVRSAHRRLDKHSAHSIKHILPELIYEYLPYGYAAIGIFIIMVTKNPMFQFLAFSLFIIAIRNLVCRHKNRSKKPSKF